MTINQDAFRMRYGVRKPQELFNPRLVPIINFPGMPWGSVLHYIGEGIDDVGPSVDNMFLRAYKSSIMVDTIREAAADKGNPRKLAVNIQSMIKSYHVKNFRMRPLKKWPTIAGEKRTPIVVNYAMFPYTVRYVKNFMTTYNRWFNLYSTVWKTVGELASQYDRQHFIPISIPSDMPAIVDFRKAQSMLDSLVSTDEKAGNEGFDIEPHDIVETSAGIEYLSEGQLTAGLEADEISISAGQKREDADDGSWLNIINKFFKWLDVIGDAPGLESLTRPMLEVFADETALTLLDLWAWLGDEREKSLMHVLPEDALKKINLCFVEAGRITVLNLGLLNSVRKDPNAEKPKGMDPKQAQRLLLKYLDSVLQARSLKSSEDTERAMEEGEDGEVDLIDTGTVADVDSIEDEPIVDAPEPEIEDIEALSNEISKLLEDDSAQATPSHEEKTVSALKMQPKDKVSDETIEKIAQGDMPPEFLVKRQADELAEAGSITASDYRRIDKLATKYLEIKNPYGGEESLGEFMQIKQEDLALPEDTTLPIEMKCLPDKSMLGNTLKTMQNQYLDKVFKKDVVSNIMSGVQRNGLMVQKYKVEKVRSMMDEYDLHTVSVIPTKGAPSTFRVKVPHIRRDGTYIANGVKNRLNPQRSDLPIRKISSVEVGLTSYYGKLFVRKAERATFNADRYILNNIAARGMDQDDDTIQNLLVYTSFDYKLRLPSIYSLLSTRFAGFQTNGYTFHTNYSKRDKHFTEEEIKAHEDKNSVLIARRKDGAPIVVDFDNVFYVIENGEQVPLGTIEDMTGIEHAKRPLEILEVNIFGKPIPLGLALGYFVGFDDLLRIMQPTIRRVKVSGRTGNMDVQPNEFAVVFEDEAVIFEKGNKLVEFIFGGFNRWPKDLRRYGIINFNKPQVYEALFDRNGLGARYPRELGQVFTGFIDPITKGELEKMGAPTDMFNLFIAAAKMLMTMDYPAASDMSVMRDKGYERVAGLAYSEISRAMRVFKSKTSPAAKFEINPQAVWMGVIQDSSNALVEDSNPIANMKEQEIVVYGGFGGRGQRSLQGNHRAFHPSQLGSTSEATKDSGKVATIVYTTADPKYDSVRGTTKPWMGLDKDGPASLLSPSVMLAPASDRED